MKTFRKSVYLVMLCMAVMFTACKSDDNNNEEEQGGQGGACGHRGREQQDHADPEARLPACRPRSAS